MIGYLDDLLLGVKSHSMLMNNVANTLYTGGVWLGVEPLSPLRPQPGMEYLEPILNLAWAKVFLPLDKFWKFWTAVWLMLSDR